MAAASSLTWCWTSVAIQPLSETRFSRSSDWSARTAPWCWTEPAKPSEFTNRERQTLKWRRWPVISTPSSHLVGRRMKASPEDRLAVGTAPVDPSTRPSSHHIRRQDRPLGPHGADRNAQRKIELPVRLENELRLGRTRPGRRSVQLQVRTNQPPSRAAGVQSRSIVTPYRDHHHSENVHRRRTSCIRILGIRYQVELAWKEGEPQFRSNRAMAENRLSSLFRRMEETGTSWRATEEPSRSTKKRGTRARSWTRQAQWGPTNTSSHIMVYPRSYGSRRRKKASNRLRFRRLIILKIAERRPFDRYGLSNTAPEDPHQVPGR